MKRNREFESDSRNTISTIKSLLSLSIGGGGEGQSNRVFECRTCNRVFSSFQALGGHCASHKRPRGINDNQPPPPSTPKKHECSFCGKEFPLGQALGGHMRKHKASAAAVGDRKVTDSPASVALPSPIVKRSNSYSRRVFSMDLNLTPAENWRALFGKTITAVY